MPERDRETARIGAWAVRASTADLVIMATAALSVIVFAFVVAFAPHPQPERAPSDAHFHAGLIISDAAFYDPDTMTAVQVQRFLEKQQCSSDDGSPCLADYRQDTPDEPAQYAHCAAITGQKAERASSIIVRIAQACRISPKVLLVLLQKEQSLLTHPSAYGYQRATGYGCPDTAACDTRYFGFFNQLYNAAWQFREYTVGGASWRYHVGKVAIQYHPNAACGSSVVDIRTQATANLYNYTPYQPSPQTLAHPDVATDCSTFGNLNFWRLYKEWFGSPLVEPFPPQYDGCLNLTGGTRCTVDPLTGL
ncbi:hypothetical protein HII28_15230 [Planctomonas sp. JC2975]|uniref:hypothetical protein n=1 Tax=Planctomonas sp. JC2975 TaxID=2729626 RepID=UPI001472DFA3|nr:hypothetical protein [Planctomonas sp. JC2975]NNC13227.1 hypothetical protein [Planctomonas sp. JC2975]